MSFSIFFWLPEALSLTGVTAAENFIEGACYSFSRNVSLNSNVPGEQRDKRWCIYISSADSHEGGKKVQSPVANDTANSENFEEPFLIGATRQHGTTI